MSPKTILFGNGGGSQYAVLSEEGVNCSGGQDRIRVTMNGQHTMSKQAKQNKVRAKSQDDNVIGR